MRGGRKRRQPDDDATVQIRRTLRDIGWTPRHEPARPAPPPSPPSPGRAGRHRPARRRGRRIALLTVVLLAVALPAGGAFGLSWLRQTPTGVIGTAANGDRAAESSHAARANRSTDRDRTGSPSASATPGHHRSRSAHPSTSATRGASRSAAPATSGPVESTAVRYEHAVNDLVNKERAAAGCGPLAYDDRLAAAARKHSADMAKRDYFDHNTPEGVSPWDRIKDEGYQQPSAENIAAGQPTPEAVVDAWMHSSGHRANILNCSSHSAGVGYATGGSYGTYWTQDFGYE